MKAVLLYAAASLVVIAAGGWVFGVLFATPQEREAVWTSAAIAFVVQLAAFGVARLLGRERVIIGWAIGALVSLGTLVCYAFAAQALGMPLAAALLSMAAFLFVTEVIEPLLLAL